MNKLNKQKFYKDKICIGSANFGFNYGYKGSLIKKNDLKKIISKAKRDKIYFIDTAFSYKNSEKRIGELTNENFKIITKIPRIPENVVNLKKWLINKTNNSLFKLKRKKIYAILIHNSKDLDDKKKSKIILEHLESLKKKNIVKKIGVSVYNIKELKKSFNVYKFDIVQFPFNIFDNRIENSKYILKLKDQKVELHARSIFLQGLLLEDSSRIKKEFYKYKKFILKFEKWIKKKNISKIEACINHVFSSKIIDKIIVGLTTYSQFEELTKILNNKKNNAAKIPKFKNINSGLLDPRTWKV
ncbi:MAG: hypothetical protein CMF94_05485 [Candidatus Marinimicrobia bacterium]|nr:hypothetical protein [Candidatus Neomarinimicrobiota bacterium]